MEYENLIKINFTHKLSTDLRFYCFYFSSSNTRLVDKFLGPNFGTCKINSVTYSLYITHLVVRIGYK